MHSNISKSSAICRTCELTSEELFKGSTRNKDYPEKTLSDMLLELAKIDINESAEMLPQHFCVCCAEKLQAAYEFVMQAQRVNQRMLATLNTERFEDNADCLLESPIDITSKSFTQVKIELDVDEETLFIRSLADGKIRDGQSCSKEDNGETRFSNDSSAESCSNSDNNFQIEQRKIDLLCYDGTENGLNSKNTNAESDKRIDQDLYDTTLRIRQRKFKSYISSGTDEDLDDMPLTQRRQGRPCFSKQKINKDGRYVCNMCNKTFAWYKDMQRHARSHSLEALFVCDNCDKGFQRRDKYLNHMRMHTKRKNAVKHNKRTNFGERLYFIGSRFKRLECKICASECQTIKQLYDHLETHSNISTLQYLNMDNSVVKEFFGNSKLTLEQIKQVISTDITAGAFNKYYCVLNMYGYELSIEDTDVEANNETGEMKYVCELCGENFARKYQIFKHTQEYHKLDLLPYRCNVCKLVFASSAFYEQHTRTQCRNRDKKYKCLRCPGKFMWSENLEKHKCADNVKKLDIQEKQKGHKVETSDQCHQIRSNKNWNHRHQCCLCNRHFNRLKDLRDHLFMHHDGFTGIDKKNGLFFKTYYPAGYVGKEIELRMSISADFASQDYSRYYSALNYENCEEVDLYDSDNTTDKEEECRTNKEKPQKTFYTCDMCGAESQRRKHMMQHQLRLHKAELEQMPYSCSRCQQKYVCAELLEQHQLRDCFNRHKQFKCIKCGARFVWQENYNIHMQVRHEEKAKLQSAGPKQIAKKLQCELCDKVFIWPKDLTRHKRVHFPNTERHECPYCERKFLRKDNMQSHLKVHGEDAKRCRAAKVRCLDIQLCKPHGCKRIQCMICRTMHQKISDLRMHLNTHRNINDLTALVTNKTIDLPTLSQTLYPEFHQPLCENQLLGRIVSDITQDQVERFCSITNEAGYELSLESSETDSDCETELERCITGAMLHKYACELCTNVFRRKYQLYAHQLEKHHWEDANHVCVHCQARFVSQLLLNQHWRALCKNSQRRFVCRKCPQRFRWKDNYNAHLNTHYNVFDVKQSIFECLECHRNFQMQKDLTRHMLIHTRNEAVLSCHWCPRKFHRYQNLVQHTERHGIAAHEMAYVDTLINVYKYSNGKKSIFCKVCGIKFDRIVELRSHILDSPAAHHDYQSMLNYTITNQLGYEMHLDDSETDVEEKAEGTPRIYKCEICQLLCRRKYELFRHQQAIHKLEKIALKCTHCVFRSVSKDLLNHHTTTQCGNQEKKYKCENCNFKFMWLENLNQHMQLHHIDSQPSIGAKADVVEIKQNFQCLQCSCKYNRKDRLSAHIKKVHGDMDSSITKTKISINVPDGVKKSDGKRFLCAFCGKAVSSSSNLIIHMRRHTGEKPFKCDFCDMAFARSSDMQCHRRTHTGERPYKCTVCEKAFARSYKLHQHMRIHNGDRPYKCTYCEKTFTQSNDLTLHIRRHTGERPYVCGICGECFIQGTALKNHRVMRNHFEQTAKPVRRTILEQFPLN